MPRSVGEASRDGRARLLPQCLTARANPALRGAKGVGVDIAAVFLVVAGDNPEQMSSAAAFATLCGVSPVGLSRERLCATASTGTAIARPIAPDGSLS